MVALVIAAATPLVVAPPEAHAATAEEAVQTLPGFSLVTSAVERVDDNHYNVTLPGDVAGKLTGGLFRASSGGTTGPWRGWISITDPAGVNLSEHAELASLTVTSAFVVVANTDGDIALIDLPAQYKTSLEPFFEGKQAITIGSGVNLFVAAGVTSGVAKLFLEQAGAPTSVRVIGTVGPAVIKRILNKPVTSAESYGKVAIVTSAFKPGVYNSVPTPLTNLVGLEVKRAVVWGEKTAGGFQFGGEFAASVKAYGATVDVTQGAVTVSGTASARIIDVVGLTSVATDTAVSSNLSGLKLKKLGVRARFATAAAKQSALAITVGVSVPGQAQAALSYLEGALVLSNTSSKTGTVAFLRATRIDLGTLIGSGSFTLDNAMIMVSSIASPPTWKVNDLPAVLRDNLTAVGYKNTDAITPSLGVRVAAKVTIGSGTGPLASVGNLLTGTYFLEGKLEKKQGSAPSLEVAVTLASPPALPRPLSDFVTMNTARFFVRLGDGFEAGLGGTMTFMLPTAVQVEGSMYVKLGGASGAAVNVSAKLISDWTDAFELAGISLLADTALSFAAEASGAVRVMTIGKVRFKNGTEVLDFTLGGGVNILFSTGIPSVKGFALKVEATELDLLTPVKVGQVALRAIAGLGTKLGLSATMVASLNRVKSVDLVGKAKERLPTAEPLKSMAAFKLKGVTSSDKALLYIATPGMTDAALTDFTDVGIKVSAGLYHGTNANPLAAVKASVTTSGVSLFADSQLTLPIHPLLQVKKPKIDLVIDPSDLLNARFAIKGTATMFGLAEADVKAKVTSTSFDGEMTLSFGGIEGATVGMSAAVGSSASDLTLSVLVSPAKIIAGIKSVANQFLGTSSDAVARTEAAALAVQTAEQALTDALALATQQKRDAQNKVTDAQNQLNQLISRRSGVAGRRTDLHDRIEKATLALDLKLALELTAQLTALELESLAIDGLVTTAQAAVTAASQTVSYAPVRLHPAVVAAQSAVDAARVNAEIVALSNSAIQGARDTVNALSDAATSAVVVQSFELKNASLSAALNGTPQTFTVVMRVNGKTVTLNPTYKLSTPSSVSLNSVGTGLVTAAGGVPTQAQIDARVKTIGAGYGDVRFYKDQARNGTANWIAGKRIGAPGWGEFAMVFGGTGGTIYGITYDHHIIKMVDQKRDGTIQWAGPSLVLDVNGRPGDWPDERKHVLIAGGWNGYTGYIWGSDFRIFKDFNQVYSHTYFNGTDPNAPAMTRLIGGSDYVFYMTDVNGNLYCYRANQEAGRLSEPGSDGGGARAKQIGSGWNNYTRIIGGEGGIIYAVDYNGNLIFRHHTGRAACTADWGTDDNKSIGSGWDMFQHLVGGDSGVIYGVMRQSIDVVPGATIALYAPAQQRFLRVNRELVDTAGRVPYGRLLPEGWNWEKFVVVDAGNGLVALWSRSHKKFVRINPNTWTLDVSGAENPVLPSDWSWERFQVITAQTPNGGAPRGMVRLYSPHHKRYVVVKSDGSVVAEASPSTTRTNGYGDSVFEVSPASFDP
ncbi:MAG: hypothetical protein KA201_03410 [Kofleriaceae bacterium]|nr:hypothetical protein [Kofleriaceae bacterium]